MKFQAEHQGPHRKETRWRLVLLAIGIFFLFSLLIVKFHRLQIIQGEKWTRIAQRQHFFFIDEPFVRGRFFSNVDVKLGHNEDPQPFVRDIQMFHLFADPLSIPKEYKDTVAETLWKKIAKDGDYLAFRNEFFKASRSRKLMMWLEQSQQGEILAWWRPFAKERRIPANALYFTKDYRRSYPFGKLLGPLLHTIQERKDEITKQALPTGGLEYHFQKELKGNLGKRRLMRSPRHSMEIGEVIESPLDGADVYLTINHCLQAILEEEIAIGVERAQARRGWAILMDPSSGDILAFAQYPFFYPGDYQEYFNDSLKSEDAVVHALTDAFEPGSTMKPITLAIALQANKVLLERGEKPLFDPEEKIDTKNGNFPGRPPLKDTRLHYYLNMDLALQKSSNIYVARLVERIIQRLGADWYRSQLVDTFGFGDKTGIELPAESPGVVPLPGRKHPNGKLEWSVPTPFSLAMGYNLQVNSLQVLKAYAILANGGYRVNPTLVKRIERTESDGSVSLLLDNSQRRRLENAPRVLDEKIRNDLLNTMKYVTKPGGSGYRANLFKYTEVGKTGTSRKIVDGQYSTKKYFSSFVGFAPLSKPTYVLFVGIDEPLAQYIPGIGTNLYGSVCAAPVFKAIFHRVFEYLGIRQDDPDNKDWREEVTRLGDLYQNWNNPR
jgi:cell division protein FtsI (penicillin-binding protein 3)